MKVLYIVGSCLKKNTSANMSHNSFVQGLLENNCDVDIIMAKDSWGEEDNGLPIFEKANYNMYDSVEISEKMRQIFHNKIIKQQTNEIMLDVKANNVTKKRYSIKKLLKNVFYTIFPRDPVYPLERKWIKNASKYKSNEKYDLVISNSSPSASHKVAKNLIDKGNILCDKWIQIWEDPWYFDLYGNHFEGIKEEEHCLLAAASEIYYVSPLTLEYQKEYYSDCAQKMKFIPLPALRYGKSITREKKEKLSFGYFGDYYSHTRNLIPFYETVCEQKYKTYIYGDSDLNLKSTEEVTVSGRVTLDVLTKIQNKTDVLVHVCNLYGGQIPGKIFHYSLTDKPILFILDGKEKEKQIIYDYFSRYNRYYFCNNNQNDIRKVIDKIVNEDCERKWEQITNFLPKEVIKQIV